jgi:hypothetical protein
VLQKLLTAVGLGIAGRSSHGVTACVDRSLVDLLFSVESNMQVVAKGVSVVSSLTTPVECAWACRWGVVLPTPVIALGLCFVGFFLFFPSRCDSLSSSLRMEILRLLSRAMTMADTASASFSKCWIRHKLLVFRR